MGDIDFNKHTGEPASGRRVKACLEGIISIYWQVLHIDEVFLEGSQVISDQKEQE